MDENLELIGLIPSDLLEERKKKIGMLVGSNIKASLEGHRIVIWSPEDGYLLFEAGFFGKPLGIRKPKLYRYKVPYELSFYDGLYLLDRNVIRIFRDGKKVSRKTLISIARLVIDDFDAKYRVYEDLRNKGFIVKPGLKYGADFVVYVYGPGIDHSPFVVSVFSRKVELKGQDFLRSGRLSWSVRKRWVLACVSNVIRYFVFEWDKELSV